MDLLFYTGGLLSGLFANSAEKPTHLLGIAGVIG